MTTISPPHSLGERYPSGPIRAAHEEALQAYLNAPAAVAIVTDYARDLFPLGTDDSPAGINRLVQILLPLAKEALQEEEEQEAREAADPDYPRKRTISDATLRRCTDLFFTMIYNLTPSQGKALEDHPEFFHRFKTVVSYAWIFPLRELKALNLSPKPMAKDFQTLINYCNENTKDKRSASVAELLAEHCRHNYGTLLPNATYGMDLQKTHLAFPTPTEDWVYQDLIREENIQIPPDMMERCNNTIGRFSFV